MGRRLRFLQPAGTAEITIRTVQRRFLLVPREEIRETILGVLGRAQEREPVEIHAFCWMSNHAHLIVTAEDAQQLSRFCGFLFGNIARKVGVQVDWQTKFWGCRYGAVPISAEEEAQVARLRYVLAQGCKEGLVKSPKDWPGANSTQALLDGSMTIEGTWVNETKRYRARQRHKSFQQSDFEERHAIRLSPLPCWRHLEPREVRRRITEMVVEIEALTAVRHLGDGTRPLGIRKVVAKDPHGRPTEAEDSKSSRPLCHYATKAAFWEFWRLYRAFVAAFREAAEKLRSGYRDVEFPIGSFPPPAPFVTDSS